MNRGFKAIVACFLLVLLLMLPSLDQSMRPEIVSAQQANSVMLFKVPGGMSVKLGVTGLGFSTQAVTITDLGHLGGNVSISAALDINNLGQVVGYDQTDPFTSSSQTHAFLWTAVGGMRDLGSLGANYSIAASINELGQVVGVSKTVSGLQHAFLWTVEGGMVDLGILGGTVGANFSHAASINELGQVVGSSSTADSGIHAFLWTAAGGMVDLGSLVGSLGYSNASGINNLGQVVGSSAAASAESHAFLWTAAGGMVDLGSLGGRNSWATGINNLGQVVGYSQTASGESHAFLWTAEDGMRDLGTLGGDFSLAASINELGQVVGSSSTADSGIHAFLWTAAGGMVDLGTMVGNFSEAYSINDLGQVVGWGTAPLGVDALLWTLSNDITPPATLANLAVSAVTMDSVTLSWTAPGDDGNVGIATIYDIRYSTSPITEANWSSATQVVGEPVPKVAGTPESFTVTGLSPATTYYFALKIADEVSNWSGLSNVAVGTTVGIRIIQPEAGKTFWIEAEPEPTMPTIIAKAELVGIVPPPPLTLGEFVWNATVRYTEFGRNDSQFFGPNSMLGETGASWAPDFKNIVMGGEMEIAVSVTIGGKLYQDKVIVYIRARNPDKTTIKEELDSLILQAISYKETWPGHRWLQFHPESDLRWGLPEHEREVETGGGWGLMQITWKPTIADIWNWKQNVKSGKQTYKEGKSFSRECVTYFEGLYPEDQAKIRLSKEQHEEQASHYYNRGQLDGCYWLWNPTLKNWYINPAAPRDPMTGRTYAQDVMQIVSLVNAGSPPPEW